MDQISETELVRCSNYANLRDAIAKTPFLIDDALAAIVTTGLEDKYTDFDSQLAAMMQAMIGKAVMKHLQSKKVESRLHSTIENILMPSSYLSKVTKIISCSKDLNEKIALDVRVRTDKSLHVTSKREERFKTNIQFVSKKSYRYLSSSSAFPP